MSFNRKQFRELITSVLKEVNLYSEAAVELLLGTAAQESGFGTALRQYGGPAIGPFQIEPRTHEGLIAYAKSRPEIQRVIDQYVPPDSDLMDRHRALETDLVYSIIMCRLYYLRIPKPLPAATDVTGLAAYWKKYYNTYLGKGTVEEFVHNYAKFVKPSQGVIA